MVTETGNLCMTIAWPREQVEHWWRQNWLGRRDTVRELIVQTVHSRSARLHDGDGHGTGTAGALPSLPLPTGEGGPFEAFFHRYEREIFGYLWRVTGEEQVAYDLCQECFVRAWQHFDKVSTYEQPRAWLFRVATNLALNHRRHQTFATSAITQLLPPTDAAGDPAASVAERDAVRDALLALPVRQRTVLVLRVVYGLDFDQIAAALGVSIAATKMTLSRGREQFRVRYLHGHTDHGETYR